MTPATSPRRPTTSTAACKSRDLRYSAQGAPMTAQHPPPPPAKDPPPPPPPGRHEPGARERIRAAHAAAGRRIGVLDDDPTGSQTVHDVALVTVFAADEYAAGLAP